MRNKKVVLLAAAATAAVLAVVAAAVGGAVVFFGLYDVGAVTPHWQRTYQLLEKTMEASVRRQADGIAEPPLAEETQALRGAACFRDKCVQCHGAPGVAPGDLGKSMQPLPGPLVDAARRWRPRELYWLTRNGIRMSGMPAWQHRLREDELWELVAFMQRLPDLNARDYAAWLQRAPAAPACGAGAARPPLVPETVATVAPDIGRGRTLLNQYACNSCHVIPRITGPRSFVGPPLQGIGGRHFIAGTLLNNPDNMMRWLTATQQVKPGTAMPELGVTERDAHDIAGYLATLK